MGYLTKTKYEIYMKRLKEINESKERKRKLKEEKQKYRTKLKLPSTSKLILLGVILLCLQIVIFCEYTMIVLGDTSAMYVLIGIPATLIPTIMSYYSKAKAENTVGGIVYETAMMENLNQVQQGNIENFTETYSNEAQG